MGVWEHIKECVKESVSLIVPFSVGVLLYSIIGREEFNVYVYGIWMFSVGVLWTTSHNIRKRNKKI